MEQSTLPQTWKAGYIFQTVLFWDDQVTANVSAIIQIKIYFKGLGFFKAAILILIQL